jgi:hypothetical protein
MGSALTWGKFGQATVANVAGPFLRNAFNYTTGVDELPNPGEPIRPTPIQYPVSPRLERIRFMSRLLDQSIVLPGGYRIGIDPIIGLLPGIGDFVAMSISFYLVYEAARLGLPTMVLIRMSTNVLIETLVGEIPILGDIFDAVWKANMRNARLVEKHYNPAAPERSGGKIILSLALMYLGVLIIAVLTFVWLVSALLNFLGIVI